MFMFTFQPMVLRSRMNTLINNNPNIMITNNIQLLNIKWVALYGLLQLNKILKLRFIRQTNIFKTVFLSTLMGFIVFL